MQKEISLGKEKIIYTLRKNRRAKRIIISIKRGGNLYVTLPYFAGASDAEKFLKQKEDWILKKIHFMKNEGQGNLLSKTNKKEYEKFKKSARSLIEKRVEEMNKIYGHKYNRISIRNQQTRWGSCSSNGNLNFSYKIALLPRKYTDYIIVHELCHLKEMNHSKDFWNLVSIAVPEYKEIRKKIKKL